MKGRRLLASVAVLMLLLVLTVGLSQAQGPGPQEITEPQAPVGSAFTYQGYLSDGDEPADGDYDMQFILYDALSGGSQVGSIVVKEDVVVTDGIFTVALDFGSVFDGTALWLEAAVRPGGSTGSYTILSPRQGITPAPYALYALNVAQHDHFGQTWTGSASDGLNIGNASGDAWTSGVRGWSESPNYGIGVGGYATAASGLTHGVWGESSSTGGYGVVGKATATSGTTFGLHGSAASPEGTGVYGENTAASGNTFGVRGAVSSPDGVGGYFHNTQGGNAVYLVGHAAQTLESNGLVKAAVAGQCGPMPVYKCLVSRSFNTVGETITITPGASTGEFTIDFGFAVGERFWVATSTNPVVQIGCHTGSSDTELDCESNGTLFSLMVLVY